MGVSQSHSIVTALKGLLKVNGVKVKPKGLQKFLDAVDRYAPWFLVSGSLTKGSWEKLGKDFTCTSKEGDLPFGVMPIWSIVRECMEDPAGISELKRGAEELERLKEERSEEGSQDQEQGTCGGSSLYPPLSSSEDLCLSFSEDEKSGSASEIEEEGRHTQHFR